MPEGNEKTITDPNALTILRIITGTLKKLKDKTAIILWSSYILIALWGFKGDTGVLTRELLPRIFGKDWLVTLFPGIPWREQLFSYLAGFILLVVIPCCIIKFYFKEKLSAYGLAWPMDKTNLKLGWLTFCVTLAVCLPIFYMGTSDTGMQHEYPLFVTRTPTAEVTPGALEVMKIDGEIRKVDGETWHIRVTTWSGFVVYQLVYFLFFVVIEFIFRGYLLFGLYGIEDVNALKGVKGEKGPLVFGFYSILIQMLAYVTWHISKPIPEYTGALFWGVAMAAVALKIKSIWHIILVHWLLNVMVDLAMCLRFNYITG